MEDRPVDRIRRNQAELAELSDAELVGRLERLVPLPDADDDDAGWNDDETFRRAEWLVAFGDEVGGRRLAGAIRLLFKKVPLGDGFGMMMDMPHAAEHAVEGNWDRLTAIMRELAADERAGTRRWAVFELGRLRDPSTLDDLVAVALGDGEPLVRDEAFMSVRMLADVPDPASREKARTTLHRAAETDGSQDLRYHAADLLADLDPVTAAPLQRPAPSRPFMDPTWLGDVSGRDGAEATRRVIRGLITGTLGHPVVDEYVRRTGRQVVMTPGSDVYPPGEPGLLPDGSPPMWHANIVIWTAPGSQGSREPSPLVAVIELRRAGIEEVRARLVDVVST